MTDADAKRIALTLIRAAQSDVLAAAVEHEPLARERLIGEIDGKIAAAVLIIEAAMVDAGVAEGRA